MPVPSSISDLSETPSANSPLGTENVGTQMNGYIQAAFAFIAQLNATLNPTGTLTAPSGTRLVMQQLSAPAGWTVDTSATFTDALMRFNQSVSSGGTAAFSTWNGATPTGTTGSTALTTAQMPSHSHTVQDPGHVHGAAVADPGHAHAVADPGHAHAVLGSFGDSGGATVTHINAGLNNDVNSTTGAAVTGIGIYAATTGIGVSIGGAVTGISLVAAGSGAGHTHTFGLTAPNIAYADCIVAIKS